ncbi:MAG: hypothetical protein CMJ21_04370 [Phycisphaerae bacterium]|nr:hypothetical protein [Phycisphaerae bacterium]
MGRVAFAREQWTIADMNQGTSNFAVGLTAIAALIGLFAMLALFGYIPSHLEPGYVVHVDLPDAGGLTRESRVKLAGIDVGHVRAVSLKPPDTRGVTVKLLISPDIRISSKARALVETSSFIGGTTMLVVDLDHISVAESLEPYLPTDGTARIEGMSVSPGGEIAQELKKAFGSVLQGPMNKLDRLVTAFDHLSAEWAEVGKNLNELIVKRSVDSVDGEGQAANLSSVLARVDQNLIQLRTVVDGVNQWVNDEQMRKDAGEAIANAKTLTVTLRDDAVKAGDLLDKASAGFDQITERFTVASDEISGAMASLRQVLDTARTGEGTVSRMLNDPSLYDNLNDAIIRAGQMIEDMKLLIERLEKEGIPVRLDK